MKLIQRIHNGELWWYAEFSNYPQAPLWGIGRVWKMPTIDMAMRIVNAWKILVIDGRPYYFDKWRTMTWKAYGT